MVNINDGKELEKLKVGDVFKLTEGLNVLITDMGQNLMNIQTEHISVMAFPLGDNSYKLQDKEIIL
jgi:hypothetical protein